MPIKIITGDCRDVLKTLPDESVHCCVTSPPYWGLRDYGTATWESGDADCDHSFDRSNGGAASTLGGGKATQISGSVYRDCIKCGARRIDNQIGLEPDFNAYVAIMVEVFREVRRVLRPDGTLWINLGDSYAANRAYQVTDNKHTDVGNHMAMRVPACLKPKDLCGIPWRVAFALQADGWWLRQDIIWSKPNPMPESVTDRCTKAHEYVFLLSKSARYYYDAEAIREENAEGYTDPAIMRRHRESKTAVERNDAFHANGENAARYNGHGRNKRSVWEVATAPFSEAHFATFPPALIEPCIKAGCPKDGTVLDPFAGAGTTGLVADRLQRSSVLIELNPGYRDMAKGRITDDAPLFAEVRLGAGALEPARFNRQIQQLGDCDRNARLAERPILRSPKADA